MNQDSASRTATPYGDLVGTACGVDLAPGSEDEGWVIPPPVLLTDGSTVQLFKDAEAVHAAYRAVASAKRRICLETYIFRPDATGRAFAKLLARRAREGLEVRVICDAFGSSTADPEPIRTMRAAGVEVREFHPWKPWRARHGWYPHKRDHRKLLVIDGEIGGLGGQDVGDEYGAWLRSSPSRPPWRDTAVGLRGPVVLLLAEAFERTWRYVGEGGGIARAEFFSGGDAAADCCSHRPNADAGSSSPVAEDSLTLLAAVPRQGSPLEPALHELLRAASASVELTMAYFAPPRDLVEHLCRLARGGVRVRLMLPAHSDVPLLVTAARGLYERLLGAGVEIYERQRAMLHAKTACVDRRVTLVGSTNFDWRSVRYNCELSAVIRSAELGAQLCELFEHDVRFARRIELGQWRRRPVRDRVAQWAVKLARPLL